MGSVRLNVKTHVAGDFAVACMRALGEGVTLCGGETGRSIFETVV